LTWLIRLPVRTSWTCIGPYGVSATLPVTVRPDADFVPLALSLLPVPAADAGEELVEEVLPDVPDGPAAVTSAAE
jgi:hypothetical protein